MKKALTAFAYILRNPTRAKYIFKLYHSLQGRYKLTIILTHAYREALYNKVKITSNNGVLATNTKQQQIINIHDGTLRSGGLTDRLKGICTLYQFAKKNHHSFKIFFVHPFPLEKYLIPNSCDWKINAESISYDLNKVAIYTWENENMALPFFETNFDKPQLHVNCNSGESFENYSELFHELFRPSPLLERHIEYHLKCLGGAGRYVSISFRFQNLLGEFKEGNSTALDEEKRQALIEKCLSMIHEITLQHNDIEKVLVTSDSNIFREIATSTYPYVYTFILPEEVGHLDYSKAGKAKELTAFLDMYLISKGKKAYQIRNEEMYNSDFPNMAARMNNVPYEMILIN